MFLSHFVTVTSLWWHYPWRLLGDGFMAHTFLINWLIDADNIMIIKPEAQSSRELKYLEQDRAQPGIFSSLWRSGWIWQKLNMMSQWVRWAPNVPSNPFLITRPQKLPDVRKNWPCHLISCKFQIYISGGPRENNSFHGKFLQKSLKFRRNDFYVTLAKDWPAML